MHVRRRHFIQGGLAIAALGVPATARAEAERFGGDADVTAELQREIDAAARRGRAFLIPAGTLHIARLRLHSGARLIGVRGETKLLLAGEGPLIIAEGVGRITLTGIVFDGAGRSLDEDRGLVDCTGVGDILISDCAFQGAAGVGLRLSRCGGWIERSDVRDIAAAGIVSVDATGLVISDNIVQRCSDSGIQVRRTAAGDDGTHVTGNRVLDIRAASGSDGGSGDGVRLLRSSGVTVSGNTIRRCAASAVRNTGGRGVLVTGNDCAGLGETAIIAEGGFQGCIISSNAIDGAIAGIQMVDDTGEDGQGATCSGNVVRNLRASPDHTGHERGYETGIKVEAAVTVTGNLVEGAPWVGILAGWGASLRDVTITGNVVRGSPIGIGVSVAKGAGSAIVSGNAVSGATIGAVVGMDADKVTTGDLAKGATAPASLAVSGNHAI